MGTHKRSTFYPLRLSHHEDICWVGGNLRFSLSDAVPSLAGFIHQEEEEVIPQMVPEALAYRKGWARV